MPKGRTEQFSWTRFSDPETGAAVARLEPPRKAACIRNYFYQKTFTDDGRRFVFGCDLDGAMDLWILDVENGEARQLTEGGKGNIQSSYLSHDDRSVYFNRGREAHVRLDLESLEETVVYRVPEGWAAYGTWEANDDCTRVAGIEMLQADQVKDGSGWERFARQFEAKPRQRLIDIDLATGKATTIIDEKRFIGHPMFRPGHDELLGFCHEGPHDLIDSRIWLVRSDGSGLRNAKDQEPGESCTHEFWLPDGSRLIYVSYRKGGQDRSIWAFDPETWTNEHVMDMPPCAHLMAGPDGRFLVGDGAGQLGDVSDKEAHGFQPDHRIYLFDLAERTCRPVCRHGTSWAVYDGNTQASHPHPSFTPDGKRVYFASDASGALALYLADVPR